MQPDEARATLFLTQTKVILVALLGGLLVFAGIAIRFVHGGDGPWGKNEAFGQILTWMSVGLLVVLTPLAFALPSTLVRNQVRVLAACTNGKDQDDLQSLGQIFQAATITYLAPIEGSGFIACIAYMIGGHPVALGVVLTVMVLMLIRFPTALRFHDWMQVQEQALAEIRPGRK